MSNQPTLLEDLARAIVPIAIVGAALAGYVFFGRAPAAETAAPPPPAAVMVVAEELVQFSDPIEIVVDGVAQPHRHISVASEVSGKVKYKNPKCNDGQFVEASTLLYEIDPTDYQSTVDRIKEELAQAENAIKEWQVDRNNAQEQLNLAEQDLAFTTNEANRMRDLLKKKVASEVEVDRGLRTEVAAKLAVQNLRNQVRALDARKARSESALQLQRIALGKAERDLERTRISAPVDCIVVTDDCEVGGYVQSGKVVAILNDVNRAEVGCQLELEDLFWVWKARGTNAPSIEPIKPGQIYDVPPIPVTVEFPFHDRLCRWEGFISRFGGTGIDLSTRTIPCRVLVENPTLSKVFTLEGQPASDISPPPLATGMFVTVRIPIQTQTELISVSSNAVRSGGVVWLNRNGKLKIQTVKVARRMQNRVLLHRDGGIEPGDRVITSPLAVATDGMAVIESETRTSETSPSQDQNEQTNSEQPAQ